MRDGGRAETQAEGEAAPSREPDVGLDPGTPGSHPGPKAGAKPLSHPGCPIYLIFNLSLKSNKMNSKNSTWILVEVK